MPTELTPKAAEIAACARALIATRGYNGFSYADIADAVGITKASIHHHFPSKAELVRSVLVAYRADARAGLAALADEIPDPAARLRAWIHFWQDCLRERTLPFCVCAMLATEMPTIPAEVGAEVRGHFDDLSQWLAQVLADGVRAGRFALRGRPPAEALALMASIHGAMVSARAYDDAAVFAAISDGLVDRLLVRH
jgi:TetR/AcrR family transcriptional regulator, transcriptional repressor for nem operon